MLERALLGLMGVRGGFFNTNAFPRACGALITQSDHEEKDNKWTLAHVTRMAPMTMRSEPPSSIQPEGCNAARTAPVAADNGAWAGQQEAAGSGSEGIEG